MAEEVYIALGSNLDGPEQQIQQAFLELAQLPNSQLVGTSSLYATPAWGITEQPDFINAVAKISTTLAPQALLTHLLAIEEAHLRVRRVRWGPRTLDCDILLYGQHVMQTENLTIPHPGVIDRAFVLVPLAEIAPDLLFPNGKRIDFYLSQCDTSTVVRITV